MTKVAHHANFITMQKRERKPVAFDMACDLLDDLDVWLREQDLPPTKRAVMETALKEFLEKRRKGKK